MRSGLLAVLALLALTALLAWLVPLTCAGHGRRIRQRPVVAVLAVAAPRALAVVEAVRWTARALQVLRRRLVEASAARCRREGEEEEEEEGGRRRDNNISYVLLESIAF